MSRLLPLCVSTGAWVVSSLGLSRILMPWTFVYKSLCGRLSSFLLGRYVGAHQLGGVRRLGADLEGTQQLLRGWTPSSVRWKEPGGTAVGVLGVGEVRGLGAAKYPVTGNQDGSLGSTSPVAGTSEAPKKPVEE